MRTVSNLVDEFKHFLDVNHPEHSNAFSQRHPEAARAEAVAYSFFKWHGYDIQVEETPNEGGVDFRIKAKNTNFVVEVTSILRETYTEHSGMPERIISGFRCVNPYSVPHLIRSKVSSKASQMSRYNCPRILMIACEHPEYQYFLNKQNALGPEALLGRVDICGIICICPHLPYPIVNGQK